MVDGSHLSVDTAIYIQSEGEESVLVPVQPYTEQINRDPEPKPEPDFHNEFQESPDDIDMNLDQPVAPPKKN